MSVKIHDTIKPLNSDYAVSEAPDIDVNGKRLNKVIEKLQEQVESIDGFIELVTDEDIDNLE